MNRGSLHPLLLVGAVAITACGSTPAGPPAITTSTGVMEARAGDALALSIENLPEGAGVVWSGAALVTAVDDDPAASILPQPGATPAAFFLSNPEHYTDDELRGVLFVVDAGSTPGGSLKLTATITTPSSVENLGATVRVSAMLGGDSARGDALYQANCSMCHGAKGEGGNGYPGLNASPENVAGDPDWSAALLAMSARTDIDDLGVSLRADMPRWLTKPSAAGPLLTGQDFADMYEYLKTQQ